MQSALLRALLPLLVTLQYNIKTRAEEKKNLI